VVLVNFRGDVQLTGATPPQCNTGQSTPSISAARMLVRDSPLEIAGD
jgi:hypothetical protein